MMARAISSVVGMIEKMEEGLMAGKGLDLVGFGEVMRRKPLPVMVCREIGSRKRGFEKWGYANNLGLYFH
jgi:hypothetical protein